MGEPSVKTIRVRFPVALVLLGAVVVLLSVACGSDEATPTPTLILPPTVAQDADSAPEAWEIEWAETIRKGQEEGELVIVGGSATRRARPVYERFQEIFGINVFAQGGDSVRAIDRILAEREAGRHTVDIWQSGVTSMLNRLAPQGLLGNRDTPSHNQESPAALQKPGHRCGDGAFRPMKRALKISRAALTNGSRSIQSGVASVAPEGPAGNDAMLVPPSVSPRI